MFRQSRIDWSGFTKLRNEQNVIQAAECNTCRKLIRSVSQKRLQIHRNCCNRLDTNHEINHPNHATNECEDNQFAAQLSPDNHEDVADVKEQVDKALARFFFACSIPFKAVENEFFLDFVKVLCESKLHYKPPCRRVLATTVLNKVHSDIENDKKKLLNNTDSVLLVDGWRNKSANRKFLVFTLRNINVTQCLLHFNDISLDREDGGTLAEYIENAIELAKQKYNTNVFGIVTDNDNKIVCGGRLAELENNEKLLQSTCSSHSANLLIKSFIKDDLKEKIRNIVNTFHEPKLDALIKRFQGSSLKNYPDTRFCYFHDTCESILKNMNILRQIALIEDVTIPDNMMDDLFNPDFENELTTVQMNLDPICVLINKCQDPSCNIADSTQYWLSLQMPSNDYNQIIEQRMKKAIRPIAYCANLLHNKYKGLLLNDQQRDEALQFLKAHLKEFYNEYQLYCTDEVASTLAEKCDNPLLFWNLCHLHLPNLSKFATKLMLIPASTAQIEGLFSNWTYVHNEYRNRLRNDNSGKLVDIYYSLRKIHEIEMNQTIYEAFVNQDNEFN